MNHYEKLSVVLLRGLACSFGVFALCGIASAFASRAFSNDLYALYSGAYYFLTYAGYGVGGIVLFALSKPLATLIASRL